MFLLQELSIFVARSSETSRIIRFTRGVIRVSVLISANFAKAHFRRVEIWGSTSVGTHKTSHICVTPAVISITAWESSRYTVRKLITWNLNHAKSVAKESFQASTKRRPSTTKWTFVNLWGSHRFFRITMMINLLTLALHHHFYNTDK